MFRKSVLLLIMGIFLISGCVENRIKREARAFLEEYTKKYQKLDYEASKAAWLANTDISDEHDSLSVQADKALSQFIGSKEVIEKAQSLLEQKDQLNRLQVLQLKKILLMAAHRPGTIPEVRDKLIEAETKQNSLLYGFDFVIRDERGKAKIISANEIDRILVESKDLDERLAAWGASKEVGTVLKDGLADLQKLRNQVAQEMGHSSFFALEVADYGMTVDEMMTLMDGLLEELRPLYSELHTWARYELAERYNQPVPEKLPAHWLPNRWGQSWPGIVESVNMDALFEDKSAEWIVETAEDFYVSLGFDTLNQNFWERSDLYPVKKGSDRKKNNHASAWHLNLEDDYRSLMSVVPNHRWFGTTHHELGHIYYYIEYSNPDVPLLLRRGANRSYHEGIGTLMEVAASQRAYLKHLGLLSEDKQIDEMQWLLNEALDNVVFIPFSAGTMTHFEHELYEKQLPKDQYNQRWWELVETYQGIVPPSPRGEDYCDAASKTHINNDPAQYYDYALSNILVYHLHDYIAKNILKQDPRNCNYYGNEDVGDFLKKIMRPGASKDWRKVLKEATGEELSARAMLEYFQPLYDYLKEANKGRESVIANR
ncbi:M2 family metallopeptidase [candidate division KSB1 bacterium]|nr:M2 family metallopeptidase [candidate division KSB1 bacterium]NIR71871.1 M2 family metallopeptidase [candidate division KSB1 bacterium]NIS26438.1 M2 family metallopeptidase [candidate division KSB1 bacterium]NIT73208.1 M2 family metallopeptidase [candidate division KSB1 bacterium]NIU27122.1 M2 family metallopeptidase [candidate division KSB1 bacterium]